MRAGIAATPETSEHTSVHRRLTVDGDDLQTTTGLLPFQQQPFNEQVHLASSDYVLPISFDDYLLLLDWTGRQLRDTKRGHIHTDVPHIFERLNYSPEQWLKTHTSDITLQQRAFGSVERIRRYCDELKRKWIRQAADHTIC